MAKKDKKSKSPKQLYEQPVVIRYKAPRQLEAELNKILGKGNWSASQVSRFRNTSTAPPSNGLFF